MPTTGKWILVSWDSLQHKVYRVYIFDVWPEGGHHAGQERATWIEDYETLEAAQAAHPDASVKE